MYMCIRVRTYVHACCNDCTENLVIDSGAALCATLSVSHTESGRKAALPFPLESANKRVRVRPRRRRRARPDAVNQLHENDDVTITIARFQKIHSPTLPTRRASPFDSIFKHSP